jgi:hypothetical protein
MTYTASRVLPDEIFCTSCAAEEAIAEVRVANPGQEIPGATRMASARGVYLFMVALNHDFRTEDYLELHLYRRGYRAIILDGQDSNEEVNWVNAQFAEEREIAIDALAITGTIIPHAPLPPDTIAPLATYPGQKARRLRDILVSEYSQLACEENLPTDARNRVRRKIVRLSPRRAGLDLPSARPQGTPPLKLAEKALYH